MMTKHDKAAADGRHKATGHPQKGFGSRVQNALGRFAPRSWGASSSQAQQHTLIDHASNSSRGSRSKQHQLRNSGDLELSARQSTSSIGTEPGAASDTAGAGAAFGDPSRPQTGSISHISSTGSLGAGTNDANSVASGSSAQARHFSTPQHAAGTSTPADRDDLCSVATQAGSAAHSFTSLASMMTVGHADASSDGGQSLIPAGPATAASDRAVGLSTSPTAGGTPSNMSLLSAYRSSDAGGDATSVSTLPLISEAGFDEGARGFDERLLDVQTLAEEQEGEQGRPEGSSEGGPDPSSESLLQPKGRISSSHGSYTSLTSNTSEREPGLLGLSAVARMPSPGHSRMSHGQRSSSRHSFQQQLQQQLLQDLEESQEEGSISAGLPVPFSTRRRPDNDDMCSYATQAGSSVHSLSSVMSHWEGNQSQRPQWSSDGNALQGNSCRSFSSLQQQPSSRSRRSSAETAGAHTAAVSPAQFAGTSSAVSPISGGYDSIPDSPTCQQQQQRGQLGDSGGGPSLQRKNSLKGALKAVTRWGSGISQRLQRTGSGPHQQQQQQEGRRSLQQGSLTAGEGLAAADGGGHELAGFKRHATD